MERPRPPQSLDDLGHFGGAFGLDRARCDGVDAHPGAAELVGPHLGQQVQRRLAGAVDARVGARCAGGDGADVDDAPASALDHPRHELLHQDVRRTKVGVEMRVEVGVVGVERACELVDACVVDQDVDVARLRGEPPNIIRVGQIGGNETCCAACIFDLLNCFGAAFGVTPVYDNLCALSRQLERDRVADARGRPRYQCCIAVECVCHRTRLLMKGEAAAPAKGGSRMVYSTGPARASAPPRLLRCSRGTSASPAGTTPRSRRRASGTRSTRRCPAADRNRRHGWRARTHRRSRAPR